jgi:hypothetical protein
VGVLRRFLLLGATAVAFAAGSVAPSYAGTVGQHLGILITSNADFQSCGCVTSGSGTATHPYVIGPWAITAPNAQGSAITVENVTSYFTITGISTNYGDSNPADPVIHLVGVSQPTNVSNVSANADGTGVQIDSSSNITLDSISVNKMVGAGLVIMNSSNVTTSNSKYKATADGESPHNEDGLYAYNSSGLHIGGVAACPQSGACNTFDYDSGWGVYLQQSSNVTIDNASANADDTGGYVLDGSSHVNLGNSTAEAGGPICISVNGQKVPTGYANTDLVGGLMLVNNASYNTIHDDTFSGISSSSGYDIAGTGNAFYFNVCTGLDTYFNPPPDAQMGSGNTFSNICYSTSNDVTGLPPSTCKS